MRTHEKTPSWRLLIEGSGPSFSFQNFTLDKASTLSLSEYPP